MPTVNMRDPNQQADRARQAIDRARAVGQRRPPQATKPTLRFQTGGAAPQPGPGATAPPAGPRPVVGPGLQAPGGFRVGGTAAETALPIGTGREAPAGMTFAGASGGSGMPYGDDMIARRIGAMPAGPLGQMPGGGPSMAPALGPGLQAPGAGAGGGMEGQMALPPEMQGWVDSGGMDYQTAFQRAFQNRPQFQAQVLQRMGLRPGLGAAFAPPRQSDPRVSLGMPGYAL